MSNSTTRHQDLGALRRCALRMRAHWTPFLIAAGILAGAFAALAQTPPAAPDRDADGLADSLEIRLGIYPKNTADSDGDKINDVLEDANKSGVVDPTETDPARADTDGDGLQDGSEAGVAGAPPITVNGTPIAVPGAPDTDGDGIPNARDLDSDNDGISDREEMNSAYFPGHANRQSNPYIADTDGDGLNDRGEATWGTDPTAANSDGAPDLLSDGVEVSAGTNPLAFDTDHDGLPDGVGVDVANADLDGDGLKNAADWDSDNDGLRDGEEDADRDGVVDAGETNPARFDTDGDGYGDGYEHHRRPAPFNMDPLTPEGDADGDGLPNGLEVAWWKTLPDNTDSDGDLIRDDKEGPGAVGYYSVDDAGTTVPAGTPGATRRPFDSDNDGLANPLDTDSDNDGLLDTDEDANHDGILDANETDPYDPDTDNDGLSDGAEINIFATLRRVADTDGDGLSDGDEVKADPAARTDPRVRDTDGDGRDDGRGNESNLVSPASDPDGDGLPPVLDKDSDNDGLFDSVEDPNGNGAVDAGETDPLKADTDNDGLWDGLEDRNRNGAHDAGETNPRLDDTDGDGLKDGQELFGLTWDAIEIATDPTKADTDGDGVSDGVEVSTTWRSNPINPDTDGDGIKDGETITIRWKDATGTIQTTTYREDDSESEAPGNADGVPNVRDANSDWNDATSGDHDFRDRSEYAYRLLPGVLGPLHPGRVDTDGDGPSDADERRAGSDPLDATDFFSTPPSWAGQDPDNDGLYNSEETILGLATNDRDTDNDGLRDGEELDPKGVDYDHNSTPGDNQDGVAQTWSTNPNIDDTDGDTILDGDELDPTAGANPVTDPLLADGDGDRVRDDVELAGGIENPRKADTDLVRPASALTADWLLDGEEDANRNGLVDPGETNAANRDSDGDGLSEGNERYQWATDPLDPLADKDLDLIPDAVEVLTDVVPGPGVGYTDPRWVDSDIDGLNDTEPIANGTVPVFRDTDGDYLPDGYEVNKTYPGYVPLANALLPNLEDTEGDGLKDCAELALGTDPIDTDSDNDGLADGTQEAVGYGTDKEALAFQTFQPSPSYLSNPDAPNSDRDGFADDVEQADADGDGYLNAMEVDSDDDWVRDGTGIENYLADDDVDLVMNVNDGDSTDNDRLLDPAEFFLFDIGLAMNDTDREDDGLLDGNEYWHFFFHRSPVVTTGPNNDRRVRANPIDLDTDGDGLKDGLEAGLTGAQDPTQPVAPAVGRTIPGFAAYDADGTSDTEVGLWNTDADGLADGVEDANQNGLTTDHTPLGAAVETNPGDADSDNDDLWDGTENRKFVAGQRRGTPVYDPAAGDYSHVLLADTDADLLADGLEAGPEPALRLIYPPATLNPYFTAVRDPDSDDDNLSDGQEDANLSGKRDPTETDPNNCDTDNDQAKDGEEVPANRLNPALGGPKWTAGPTAPVTVIATAPSTGTPFFTGSWTVDVSNVPNPGPRDAEKFYAVATDLAWISDLPGYATPAGYLHGDILQSKIQIAPGCITLPNGNTRYTFSLNGVEPSTAPGRYRGVIYFVASAFDCAGGAIDCANAAAAAKTVVTYDSVHVIVEVPATFDLDVLDLDNGLSPRWGVGASNPAEFYSGGAAAGEMHLKGLARHDGDLTGVFWVSNPNGGPDANPADGTNDLNGRPVHPVPEWDSDPQGNARINRLSVRFAQTSGPAMPAGTVTFRPASYTPFELGKSDSVVVAVNTNNLGACGPNGRFEGTVTAWHDVDNDGIQDAGETVDDQFTLKIELVTPDLDIVDGGGSLTGNLLAATVNTAQGLPEWTFNATNAEGVSNPDAFDGPGCESWDTPSLYHPVTLAESGILANVPPGTVPGSGATASFRVVKYDPTAPSPYDPSKSFTVLIWTNQSGNVGQDQTQQYKMKIDPGTLAGLPEGDYVPYYDSNTHPDNQYVLMSVRGVASGHTRVDRRYPAVYSGGGLTSPEFGLFDRFQVKIVLQVPCGLTCGTPTPDPLTLDPGASGTITNNVAAGNCNVSNLTPSATPLQRTGGTEVMGNVVLTCDNNNLNPSGQTTCRVTVTPDDCLIDGTYTSTVTVTGSTTSGPVTCSFPITVIVRKKEIEAPNPAPLAANRGTTVQWTVTVTNAGQAPVKVGELSGDPTVLTGTGDQIGPPSISPPPGTIAIPVGGSQTFTVTAPLQTDQKAGAYTGSISWVVCARTPVSQALTLDVNADPQWTYDPNPITLDCGNRVNVTIRNTGNTDLSISASSTSTPTIAATPNPLTVPYRGAAALGLDVACTSVPAGIYAGSVSCRDVPSGKTSTLPTTVTVPDLPGLALDQPAKGSGPAGSTVTVPVRLCNSGNVDLTEVAIVEARDFNPSRGGKAILFPDLPIQTPFPLARGDCATITVNVPVDAAYFGGIYTSNVRVRGRTGGGAECFLNVTLEIDLGSTADRPMAFSDNPARYAQSRQVTVAVNGSSGPSTIKIYNAMGVLVRTLASSQSVSGGSITWDFKNDNGDLVASGLYVFIWEVDGKRHKDRLLFIK